MNHKILRCWLPLFSILFILSTSGVQAATYTLTVNTNGSGTVSPNPSNSIYPSGVVVTVTATPSAGWYFSGWSGDVGGSMNPTNVTMDANKVMTGNFLAIPAYTLTLASNGQGTISLNPAGGTYTSNTTVMATATPAPGWIFISWSGSTNSSSNPLSITMNANNSLTGTFAQPPAFDVQPQSVTNATGQTVSFSADAVGDAPLSYQWFFASGSLSGATNTTLTLTNVSSSQAGNYWIIATNNYGSATSSVVSLVLTNLSGSTNVVSSPDEASLRAAMAIGGWVGLEFNGTLTISNTINITKNVILDAHSVVAAISGGNAVRLFYVAPGVTFSATNLALANGSCIVTNGVQGAPADAGAIYNDGGTVTLVGCTVTNNSAQSLTYGGLARGGAIFNNGGALSLFQSGISNNTAIGGGPNGTPYLNPTATSLGGAIYIANGAVTFANCNVSSNSCLTVSVAGGSGLAMGGGVYQASGSLTTTNSSFAFNGALGGNGTSYVGSHPSSPAYGGALAVDGGSAAIDCCQFLANLAKGGNAGYHSSGGAAFGGAVYSASTLTVRDSSFSGNQSFTGNGTVVPTAATKGIDGYGGAIYNSGTAMFNRCAIYSNLVQGGNVIGYGPSGTATTGGSGLGGGIFNASQLAATNCTIALNFAIGGGGSGSGSGSFAILGTNGAALGGGVFNNTNGTFSSMNLTIASNNCSSPSAPASGYTNGLAAGAQTANINGTLRLHNSLIAYDGGIGNAYGIITDDGFNFSSDGSAGFASGSSFNFTDPKLGPLGDNGGPTLCISLLADSPAVDYGDTSGAPSTDQRGFFRPTGTSPDAGAYEYGSYMFALPYLKITCLTNDAVLTYTGYPSNSYRLQASTNLSTWTDVITNGPFTGPTNVSQAITQQGWKLRYFRMLLQ